MLSNQDIVDALNEECVPLELAMQYVSRDAALVRVNAIEALSRPPATPRSHLACTTTQTPAMTKPCLNAWEAWPLAMRWPMPQFGSAGGNSQGRRKNRYIALWRAPLCSMHWGECMGIRLRRHELHIFIDWRTLVAIFLSGVSRKIWPRGIQETSCWARGSKRWHEGRVLI